jgi:aspartyl-tRNA(Asn)/glutamyl-tRNA(Gln) amidotransferase subunit B
LRSAEDAADCFSRLREVLVALGVNDGNMEEGSLRCDANVSIRPSSTSPFGTKAEVKNVNSFRFLQKALEYEIDRQIALVESSGRVRQETRLWDSDSGRTVSMRSKEEAHDYRYFPEPDLPPLVVDAAWIASVRSALRELPDARKARMVATYALSDYDAEQLVRVIGGAAEYFEAAVAAGASPKAASNWIQGEIRRALKDSGAEDLSACPISAARLAELAQLTERGVISSSVAKGIFEKMWSTGLSAQTIVDAEGLGQIGETSALQALVDEVIRANPDTVAQYRGGRVATLGFLVGQVMKASGGKANPKIVSDLMKASIS